MIAFEADDATWRSSLKQYQAVNNALTVPSAINVVAEKHVTGRVVAGILVAGGEESIEFVKTAMDVSHGKGEETFGATSARVACGFVGRHVRGFNVRPLAIDGRFAS